MVTRCEWVTDDPLYIRYHDNEWGKPTHGDNALFEMLSLEGFQAGLSWLTILKRREGFRQAFANFDIDTVAQYDTAKVDELAQDARIIRHRGKITATIDNAQRIQIIQAEFGSLDAYMWGFVGGEPTVNHFASLAEVPAATDISHTMSDALKARGFKFVGATVCYAFMQACGMVIDHTLDCDWHPENLTTI